jgi:hypothetical protein
MYSRIASGNAITRIKRSDPRGGRVNEVRPQEGLAGDGAPAMAGRGDEADLGRRRRDRLQNRPHPSQGLRHLGELGLSHKLPQKDGRGGIPRAQGGHLEGGPETAVLAKPRRPRRGGLPEGPRRQDLRRVRTELLGDAVARATRRKELTA